MHKPITSLMLFVFLFILIFSPVKTRAVTGYISCSKDNGDGTMTIVSVAVTDASGNSLSSGDGSTYASNPREACKSNGGKDSFPCGKLCDGKGNGTYPLPRGRIQPETTPLYFSLMNFYDTSVNAAHPWATAGAMTTGASGVALDYLVQRLVDFGFIKKSQLFYSGGLPKSYDSIVTSGVINLQKALNLSNATPGVFTVATRDAFKNFLISQALNNITISGANEKVVNFGIVWPDGRISLYDEVTKFHSPSSSYTGIPAPASTPTFFWKNEDGKVYKSNGSGETLVSVAFPPTPISVKNIILTFSSKLSGFLTPVNSAFAANPNLQVVDGTPSTIVPNIANILSYLGFYEQFFNKVGLSTNLDSTLINAIKKFDPLVALTVNNSFDLGEASSIKSYPTFLTKAANSLPADASRLIMKWSTGGFSQFDLDSGVFYPVEIAGPNCDSCPFLYCNQGKDKGKCGGSTF